MPKNRELSQVPSGIPAHRYWAGIICLLIAVGASGILAAESLVGLSVPGCGAGSDCAKAAASVWGKIPGTSFPISYLGFAYFLSMLIGWISARDGVSAEYKWIARLGVLFSVFYMAILLIEKHYCKYCIATHIANFVFWIVVERSNAPVMNRHQIRRIAIMFILLNAATGLIHRTQKHRVDQKQEDKFKESTQDIISATSQKSDSPQAAIEKQSGQMSVGATSSEAAGGNIQRPWKGGFTGRYLHGPKEAPIRIVLLSDYQCVDCNRVEEQVREIVKKYGNIVSISMKHFPMCTDCNPSAPNLHANACWAAWAAEAAGLLAGNDGFWSMNDWLFDHHGTFSDQELKNGVISLGFDYPSFMKFLTSPETKANVKSDIQEGVWLGLQYTPMVFINGVEFKGIFAPLALTRAVDSLAATNPKPMNADFDQPPPAKEKILADWREQPIRTPPTDKQGWPIGPENAKVRVVLWGDYQEPYTAKADAIVRQMMKERGDIRYEFRHYPVNQNCNPVGALTKHEHACKAAAVAEAAGLLGGSDAYWKAHEYLMEHQANFSEATIQAAAAYAGVNLQQLSEMMVDPRVSQAIGDDARVAKALGLTSIPYIYINDKYLARWTMTDGGPLLDVVIKEAAGQK